MIKIKSRSMSSLSLCARIAAVAIFSLLSACKPVTVVEGPVGGTPVMLGSTFVDLAEVGYQQNEFFVSGTAQSYESATPLTVDGKWSVQAADSAAFKTRILVYRPSDAAKFNGTVIVEWLNVSGGVEGATEWISMHTELIRQGYAWVGVSAQKAGIDGGGVNYLGLSLPLKTINPQRYGSLLHPGDKYAYDIFSHAAKAVLQPGSFNPLGDDLRIQRAIAAGESQSADFLLTYINAIAPMEKLFDGYFVHSRLHGSAGLAPQTSGSSIDFSTRAPVHVRDDLGVPVMMVQTETDLFVLGSYADRQPDNENFRLWEIAGTGHADRYISLSGLTDKGDAHKIAAVSDAPSPVALLAGCSKPINSGPQHFVVKAAMAALENWIRNGVAPPYADRLDVDEFTNTFVRDSVGNALGGIRTPYVDAPVATLSGEGQPGSAFCQLYGTTTLFDRAQLAALYPDHATFVAAVDAAVESAIAEGFLLTPDGELIKAWAQHSTIGMF